MTAKEHYANHLAHFYSWMVGDFNAKQNEQEDFFNKNGIKPKLTKIAVDLGAGSGLQSLALAKLGFEVTAVDFNKQLLDELSINKRDLRIKTVCENVIDFLADLDRDAELIVCMGDTITHLESIDHVEQMSTKISEHLVTGGKLVISFRELIAELKGTERFIPVRSDETRILTCYLEYFPDHVMVHDILQEWQSGKWIQKVSCYPKLRLSESYITEAFERNNIKVLSTQRLSGMLYLVGQKIS